MVGGQWRGVVRNRSIPLRGVKNLLTRIFANGEQGGAYDYSDLTDEKLAWRLNQLLQSEDLTAANYFKADTTVTRNTTTTPPAGVVGLSTVRFTAVGGYIGQLINRDVVPGTKASISAIVNSTTRLLIFGGATPAGTDTYTSEDIGGGWYRQKSTRTFTVTAKQGAIQWLIAQTAIGAPINTDFVASAAQLEMNGVVSAYQRITDVSTEFLAAFPTHSLFQDNTGTLATYALEQPIGFAGDVRFGFNKTSQVVGGDFSGSTVNPAWVPSGTVSQAVVGNELELTATGSAGQETTQSIPIVAGRTYELVGFMRSLSTNGAAKSGRVQVNAGGVNQLTVEVPANGQMINIRRFFVPTASGSGQVKCAVASAAAWGSVGDKAYFSKIDVREVLGNHRTQATTTDRPIVSGRYNWFVNSQADTMVAAGNTPPTVANRVTVLGESCSTATFTSAMTSGFANCRMEGASQTTATVTNGTTYAWAFGVTLSRPLVGAETINCTVTGAAGFTNFQITSANSAGYVGQRGLASGSATVSASGVDYPVVSLGVAVGSDLTVSVCKAQIGTGSIVGPYQRVNTATDYDAVGFPKGARFNGSNSWMSATLPLAGNDKLGFAVSLRKDSDAATAMLFELSASTSANDGTYGIRAPQGASGTYGFALRGTGAAASSDASRVTNANYPAPHTAVLSCAFDLAQPDVTTQIAPQVNGVTPTLTTGGLTAAGAGNFATAVEYVGRRGGTSLPLAGMIYRDARRVGAPNDMLGLLKQWVNEPVRVTLQ